MSVELVGHLIGNRYQVLSALGEGAMGSVYLAEDVTLKRKVALKVLRKEWAERPEVQKRLENECRILAKLGPHPNIVTLYDRMVHEENVILVMEFVPGETISDLLNRTRTTARYPKTGTPVAATQSVGGPMQSAATVPVAPVQAATGTDSQQTVMIDMARPAAPADAPAPLPVLTQPDILSIVQQCLTALDFAHSRGILHRDIKPSNILVTWDHNRNLIAKVMDFGIGKALLDAGESSDATALTRAGGPGPGTPAYMAPEQIDEVRFGTVGPAADLYAMGITLYEMLTLTVPFEGTYTELLNAHTNVPPPDPTTRNPNISPSLQKVLQKALKKLPRERYSSANDFRIDLEAAGTGTIVMAPALRTAPSGSAPVKSSAAKPVLAWVLALVVLGGGIGGYLYWKSGVSTDTPASPVAGTSEGTSGAGTAPPPVPPTTTDTAAPAQPGSQIKLQEIPLQVVDEGEPVEFKLQVTGANPADLTFTAEDLPVGASFDAATQTFRWTTSAANVGQYRPTFTVSDRGSLPQTDSLPVNITVKEKPKVVMSVASEQSATEGQLLSFPVTATGPAGATLSFTAIDLPAGAAFDAASQTFTWTPPAKSAGNYNVTFTATDNGTPNPLKDSRTVAISVAPAAAAPAPEPAQAPTTPTASQQMAPTPSPPTAPPSASAPVAPPKPVKPAVPAEVKETKNATERAKDEAAKRFEGTASDYQKNSDYQEGKRLADEAKKAETQGNYEDAKSKYRDAEEKFRQAKPGTISIN